MTVTDFQALELEEQIEYYNAQLREGKSFEDVNKILGVRSDFIHRKCKRWGYLYNEETNQYEKPVMSDKFTWNPGDIKITTPAYVMRLYPDGTVHDGDILKGLTEIDEE